MTSKALLIRDALISKLKIPEIAGIGPGGVSVDPDYAFESRDLPAIAVYLRDGSNVSGYATGTFTDRNLHVIVRIVSKGSDSFASADPVMSEAYQRIMQDPSISGLAIDVMDTTTTRSRDVLEMPVSYTEINFLVSYQTSIASL